MANTLDLMDIKQIITVQTDGLSNRKIAETDISRNTINSYIKLFKACNYSFEELLGLDNASLTDLFPSHITINNNRLDELMAISNRSTNHATTLVSPFCTIFDLININF